MKSSFTCGRTKTEDFEYNDAIRRGGRGGGGERRGLGPRNDHSHNLQSGHPARWSADNCSIFSTVNDVDFLEANWQRKSRNA